MKKIFIVSLGVAILAITGNIALAQTQVKNTKAPTMNFSCVQTAVAEREAAVQQAFTKFNATVLTSLQTRATALNTAWGTTDAKTRRFQRAAAWETYRVANQTARNTLKTERTTAWNAFKTTSTGTCKVEVVETDTGDNL